MQYFTHEKITPRITRIRDICGVFEYLVEGTARACLIDTGDGFGDIKQYAGSLTDKPLFVLLTHGHVDHANGSAPFDEVHMSEKDLPIYREHGSLAFRYSHFAKFDLTKDIPHSDYAPYREKPFLPLQDKQEFDLGGLTLRAVATPGHTPGMTMVLIKEERIILFGDGCGQKVLLFDDYSSTVSEYLKSLEYVKSYETQYDRIIRNHTNGESPKILLDNVIACCRDILAGTDSAEPVVFEGISLFAARPIDPVTQMRQDGKQGNLLYREDKRC